MRHIRLILNGDDFGLSEEVNEAIIRAFNEGILTSCSLMVTGEAFDQAVRLARAHPRLAVGIHLVTVMGRAVLSKSEIPSLVDDQGRFPSDPTAAGLRYYFSRQARRELRKELAAQFERFKSTGLPLSHIDGHLHLHVHPVIFNAALELGVRYGARRMRVPQEELWLALRFDPTHPLKKAREALLFSLLARYMKWKLRARGFVFAERVYGNLQSGRMTQAYLLYALDHLRARTSEIYFHPAMYDIGQQLSRQQRQGVTEFEVLTSPQVIERLNDPEITLTNYFELELSR